MAEDLDKSPIKTGFKEVIKVARERIVKDPPKRGKLTERQIQRAVEKVVYARRSREQAEQTRQAKKKK